MWKFTSLKSVEPISQKSCLDGILKIVSQCSRTPPELPDIFYGLLRSVILKVTLAFFESRSTEPGFFLTEEQPIFVLIKILF